MDDLRIDGMARYLVKMGLRSEDFDWEKCAPGFREVFVKRGGSDDWTEEDVADVLRRRLERMEGKMPEHNPDSRAPASGSRSPNGPDASERRSP
jgi:hypothetical protein